MSAMDLVVKITLDSQGLDDGLKNSEQKASMFGDFLKANLVSKGISLATGALKAAGKAAIDFGMDSVQTGMTFDQSMSQVAATMGKTTEEIQDLRAFAQEMGSTTAFSATQAADALNYMALAGYDSEKSMQMLPNVLNLAAAGGMELATASDMITDSQSALGLSMEETTTLVDQMAKASSKSNTSVQQLGDAILTVGGTAKMLSGGTTELNTALGILADNGTKGAEGGTKLRNILLSLGSPTDQAAEAMTALGVSAYDAEGNFRPLQDIFGDLNVAMEDMTSAEKTNFISTVFNKADIKDVNALLATSSDRWDELGGYIEDASGAAEDMANTQLDNLAGDITLFQSALEGAQIAISDAVTPALRELVQWGTEGITSLSEAFQEDGLSGVLAEVGSMIGDLGSQLIEAAPGFIESGMAMLTGFIEGIVARAPEILSTGYTMFENFVNGLISGIPQLISTAANIASNLINNVGSHMPELMAQGVDMIAGFASGILSNMPSVISSIGKVMVTAVSNIANNLPQFMSKGVELIGRLANGILQNLPAIYGAIANVIAQMLSKLGAAAPQILSKGIELIGKIAAGIIQGIPKVVAAIPQVIQKIISAFTQTDWGSVGSNVISGIASGIRNGVGAIVDAARNVASNALNAAKRFLGIASPSKVMRDQVGKMIPAGIAEGIYSNMGMVEKAMSGVTGVIAEPGVLTGYKTTTTAPGGGNNLLRAIQGMTDAVTHLDESMTDKMADALDHMGLNIDRREFARLVREV